MADTDGFTKSVVGTLSLAGSKAITKRMFARMSPSVEDIRYLIYGIEKVTFYKKIQINKCDKI